MLTRKELEPGKMYRFAGRVRKLSPLAIYKKPWSTNDRDSILPYKERLYPLEPFVYLESALCSLAAASDDPWYEIKILTGTGVVGYIQVHDDDFQGMNIGFEHWTDDNL
jgi:hypothetical protein